ncbi:MAG TPA: glycine betaine/L-proline ABC transporter substrate-binding protein ProX [Paracoccus solventivorans]|uniref:Glycine betaine/L-proline ABC transporter substrate-binding protein ProX n=1 Tax=Paracoccus solventivorans TaxID=53463 RepID=A0A832PQ92_9RHOB|nr:glycine betaine/L-proline ABC transporter substrate-binding protein ProX [Paracoccus solventivorans]HHW35529.1 glycine betaine/L-proline ABC transporter substrate-binding protein ProX [Paracoccus solventivorans]
MFRLGKTLTAIGALALALAAPAMAQDRPGEGVKITMAQPTWDTGWFQTAIYSQMLRELGYDVTEPMTLDNPAFYQAVAYGDVTMWVDGWFPGHNTYRSTFEQGAEIVGAIAKGGALQGYLVDKASAEKFDIKTLEDFKRPEVREAFDRNGDGKADLVGCPPGWACEQNIEHHMDAYSLRDDVNLISANYSAAMADTVAAYGNGEPVLFYTWTPNWTVNELKLGEDVVWIQVPFVDLVEAEKGLEDAATMAGVEGCVADPCQLGYIANDIVPVVNSEFLAANPAVKALFEAAEIPLPDIYAQNAQMNAGDENVAAHAEAWIAEHREQVDGWLATAREAATD